MAPLFYLRLNDEWRERFASEIVDEGGFAEVERRLQKGWIREGRMLIPIDDYTTYRQVKTYASYETPGGWQRRFKFLADQLGEFTDPQGGLFE